MQVECYAEYRVDQEPRKLLLRNHWLEVEEILHQWREPSVVFFQVRAENRKIYLLTHEKGPDGEWTLVDESP